MKKTTLFKDGQPVYQPIEGYVYHRALSMTSRTFWTTRGSTVQRGYVRVTRQEAAKSGDISQSDLLQWENAADIEAEIVQCDDLWSDFPN